MTTLGSLPRSGDPSTWIFQQLGGDRRRLELAGTSGPMGRPRIGPVVEDELGIRHEEVNYDGTAPPTRHVFGLSHEPVELHGRWSDTYGGVGFAKAKVLEARSFVADMQPVLVTWADVFSVRGMIEKLRTPREAVGEVEWRMTILIDSDDLLGQTRPAPPPRTPRVILGDPMAALALDDLPKVPKTLRVGPFEALSSLISVVGSAGNEVNRVAGQIRSFATAPLALLKQFRAAIGQFKTTLVQLRDTFEMLPTEYALAVEGVEESMRLDDSKARFHASALDVMRALDEADRESVLALRGKAKALYAARGGDTFESIATQFYGAAARANEIREANGVPAGTNPSTGILYIIPE
jgi:hypothetical protein